MKAQYSKRPIGSLRALSQTLQVEVEILQDTASRIKHHYHLHEIPKADGNFRKIQIPTNHIKVIQKRINKHIFDNVIYPPYLHGGIKDRDYVKNATEHAGAEAVITLDVKNFYPSISRERVVSIFQHFCKFPKDVSQLLADLCTLDGLLPQGACTSSHLANLALFDCEYHFAQYCKSKGYTYTRLLDDIAISRKKPFSPQEIEKVIVSVKAMMKRCGLKLNNRKQRITARSNPETLMEVTGLWLNRGKPRAHTEDRRSIRAELHSCESAATNNRTDEDFHNLHNRLSGRVAKLSYLKHKEAANYRGRLQAILPLYDETAATAIFKQAKYLSRSKTSTRAKYAYFQQYHLVNYKANILFRNNITQATIVKKLLEGCKPIGQKDELLYGEPI
ncbi:MAG: hypothetical protein KIT86_20690 [Hydrogenophaga sp.]|uniref:reverse transcriptase family protein n=1 Tax=Hydrogenophaga sp. TaxID=1904254 RepID=UPI002611AFB8|nr:reverse transcriptase domain-containing protein [Hydrogenophaga sp.]MCW5672084.1 hypothetical protein [Hydrogenophaga sp.]